MTKDLLDNIEIIRSAINELEFIVNDFKLLFEAASFASHCEGALATAAVC